MPEVREWTESLWGNAKDNPQQAHYLRIRTVPESSPNLAKEDRIPVRMPNLNQQKQLIENSGYHCAYCSIPLVPVEVRKVFTKTMGAWIWGRSNSTQNAALQCMWLQFDHVVPHSRGGDNEHGNIVISCAPCNYGKGEYLLDELGLSDPRQTETVRTSWDGLTRLL